MLPQEKAAAHSIEGKKKKGTSYDRRTGTEEGRGTFLSEGKRSRARRPKGGSASNRDA